MSRVRGLDDKGKGKEKKEVVPGYVITENNDFINLTVVASIYLKNSKLKDDIAKIAKELDEKILSQQHTHLSLSLYLDGLPYEEQIALQKALTAIIVQCLQDETFALKSLSLHGWRIIGTADEMKSEDIKKRIRDYKEAQLRALGKALANNKVLSTLSLTDGDFSKHQLDKFFVNLDKLQTTPNTSTALKSINITDSTILKPHMAELMEKAIQHKMNLISVAPKKLEPQKDKPASSKKPAAPKKISSEKEEAATTQTAKPAKKTRIMDKEAAEALLEKLNNEDSYHADDEASDVETNSHVADTSVVVTKPHQIKPNLPSRSVARFALLTTMGGIVGISFGIPVGGIVATLGVFAELIFGNATLLTILGVGLSASGIGLVVGVAILASLVIAGIAYGIYTAEKQHQNNVANIVAGIEFIKSNEPPLLSKPAPASPSLSITPASTHGKVAFSSGKLTPPKSSPNSRFRPYAVTPSPERLNQSGSSSPGSGGLFSGSAENSSGDEKIIIMDTGKTPKSGRTPKPNE